MVRFLPWVASVAVHVLVLAGLSAFVFISFSRSEDKRQIVPEARLGEVDPSLPVYSEMKEESALGGQALMERELEREVSLPERDAAETGQKLKSLTAGKAEDVGPAAGVTGGRAVPPGTKFFNTRGNAYTVVYVVDASPSMIGLFEPLKAELKDSLDILKPMQKFHVMFFSSGSPVEGPGRGLTWASERNKRKYREFIDGVDIGEQTDPTGAIRRALELNPDLIYLLTDGDFRDKPADQIVKLSKERNIKINTIAYVNQRGAFLLREIAERTGGVYRFVSQADLQWQGL